LIWVFSENESATGETEAVKLFMFLLTPYSLTGTELIVARKGVGGTTDFGNP
jgi:hypothetical protein